MFSKDRKNSPNDQKTIVKELVVIITVKLLLILTLWKLCFSGENRVKVNKNMQEQRLLESYLKKY